MLGKNTVLFDTPPGVCTIVQEKFLYTIVPDQVNIHIYKLTRRHRINKSYEIILKMGLHWCESYNDPAMSSFLSSA